MINELKKSENKMAKKTKIESKKETSESTGVKEAQEIVNEIKEMNEMSDKQRQAIENCFKDKEVISAKNGSTFKACESFPFLDDMWSKFENIMRKEMKITQYTKFNTYHNKNITTYYKWL